MIPWTSWPGGARASRMPAPRCPGRSRRPSPAPPPARRPRGTADPALFDACRVAEALLFASAAPVRTGEIARVLPDGTTVMEVLAALRAHYEGPRRGARQGRERLGVPDPRATSADRLTVEKVRRRKLSRAGLETLAIVAYHAPVTRAEIEDIRGVSVSPGTLDILFEEGWIEPRGRKQVPGRPTTWQTTAAFLDHFGLESRNDLPGLRDLRKAGLLSPAPESPVSLPGDPDGEEAPAAWKDTA